MTDNKTTVAELRQVMASFVSARDWEKFHDAKNLTMALAIEAAELMEHFQWVRTDELDGLLADDRVRNEVRDELADVFAFVLSLANQLDLDLATALRDKMEKNVKKYPAADFKGIYQKPRG